MRHWAQNAEALCTLQYNETISNFFKTLNFILVPCWFILIKYCIFGDFLKIA